MTKFVYLSKLRWAHVAALVAVCVAVYGAVNTWLGPTIAMESVVKTDFVQTVVGSGHVESPRRVDVGAQITATVTRIPVNEGASVKAQDVLIELSAAELRAAEKQADMAVAQAQARVRQIRELQLPVAEQAVRQATTNLQNAQSVARRNENLFKQGFIGEAALDEFRKAVDLADAQLRTAQSQLQTSRPSGSDYALAESAVLQAEAAAQVARERTRYALIRAPVAGVLIGRNVEVGDVAQPGKVLMTLSPLGKTQLVLAIDEKNLRLIRLGQKALVSADAYPQQKFDATLVYINPSVNAQTGAVDVKLDIAQPPEFLRQDMTVSVDIEVARHAQTLVLPAASVHEAEGTAPWVVRLQDGMTVKVPVQTGLHSGGFIEVLQGLQGGDTVAAVAATTPVGIRARALRPSH